MFEIDSDNFSMKLAKVKLAYSGNGNDYNFDGVESVSIDNKSDEDIKSALTDSDLVFIIAGVQTLNVAKIAKEIGALTVAIVEKEIKSSDIDTFFVVDDKNKSIFQNIIKSISDLIAVPGLINLDVTDVKDILGNAGRAYSGTGEAENTTDPVKNAIKSVDGNISNSKSLLLNLLGATDGLSMMEVNDAATALQEAVNEDAEIIWGVSIEESLGDKIIATVIAARCDE